MRHFSSVIIFLSAFIILIFSSCKKNSDNPDVVKGGVLWYYEIPKEENLYIPDLPMAIGKDGDIYFEVRDLDDIDNPRIYAITKDGKFKWKTNPLGDNQLNRSKKLNSAIVIADDGVIYCTSGPFLYSINPSNGQADKLWECPETVEIDGSYVDIYSALTNLCLTNEGNLIVQNFGKPIYYWSGLYCITPGGQLKWMDIRRTTVSFNNSIGPDGNIFGYAEYWDDETETNIPYLVVTDTDNGNVLWKQPTVLNNSVHKPVFTSDGDVVFLLKQQEKTFLVRMEVNNFNTVWSIDDYERGYQYSLIDKDNNLFVMFAGPGSVYIPANITGYINSLESIFFPLIKSNLDTKGNITGGLGNNFRLTSIDKNGKILWEYENIYVNASSVILSDDEVLYYSKFSGNESDKTGNRIYAVKWDASLADGGWPRYTHDNRNTSNYNKW